MTASVELPKHGHSLLWVGPVRMATRPPNPTQLPMNLPNQASSLPKALLSVVSWTGLFSQLESSVKKVAAPFSHIIDGKGSGHHLRMEKLEVFGILLTS